MAAFGLAYEPEEEVTEIWQENAQTADVFVALTTQWNRNPMSGELTGINYGVVRETMKLMGVKKKDRPEVFHRLRTMEGAAKDALKK